MSCCFFLTLKTMTLVTWKMINTSRQESNPLHPAQQTTLLVPDHHCKQFFQPVPIQLNHSPFLMQQQTCILTLFPPSSANKSAPLFSNQFHHAQTQLSQQLNSPLFSNQFHPISTQLSKSPLQFHPIAAIPSSSSLPLLSKQFYPAQLNNLPLLYTPPSQSLSTNWSSTFQSFTINDFCSSVGPTVPVPETASEVSNLMFTTYTIPGYDHGSEQPVC